MITNHRVSKYLFYAFGEIFLVVIGILIALQINNWNENQKLAEKQNLYLLGLKQNLLDSKKELNRVINECIQTENSLITLVEEVKKDSKRFTKEELDSLMMSGLSYTKYQTRQGVIDELISSGQVSIIENDYLRAEIASWDANLINIREMEEMSKKGFLDYGNRLAAYFDFSGITPEEKIITIEKRDQFFDDLQTRNVIANIRFSSNVLGQAYKEKKSHIDTLISVIDKELKSYND